MSDFIQRLRQELSKWVEYKIISPIQKQKIILLYEKESTRLDHKESTQKIITSFTVIGSILLGLGVILFIASNWEEIPNLLRAALLTIATFSAYICGYILRYQKRNFPRTGMALLLLGALLFGASIMLIAQSYNVNANSSSLLLLWLLGVLPLAYNFNSTEIISLSIILLSVWLGFYLVDHFRLEQELLSVYFIYGILMYNSGLIHAEFNRFQKFSTPFKIIGLLLIIGINYIFTFEEMIRQYHREFFYKTFPYERDISIIPYVVIISITMISILVVTYLKRKNLVRLDGLEISAELFLLSLILLFQFSFVPGLFYPIVFNIVLFLLIIGLITLGYLRKQILLVHLGLLFFVVDVVTRYFDFFYDLLPRSLFFIVGGILLLFGGLMLEKQRQNLLKKILSEENMLTSNSK